MLERVLTVQAAAVLCCIPAVTRAQCTVPVEIATLVASDPGTGELFGCSVAVSGSTLAVGARHDRGSSAFGDERGAVYIFTRSGNTWTQQQKIVADDGTDDYLWFGTSVALSGSTLLVGAPGAPDGGAAYVFSLTGSTWSQTAVLVAADRQHGDTFGQSVALSSISNRRVALVGAPFDDNTGPTGTTGGPDAGAVYIFSLNTLTPGAVWNQQQKLVASDGGPGDLFGRSVALSGTTAIVGAPSDDNLGGAGAGSAYAFTGNITASEWTQQAKLLADDGSPDDQFGTAVAYNAGTAVIGSPNWEAGPNSPSGNLGNGGAVYVFTVSSSVWTLTQRISESFSGFNFGESVALLGDRLIGGRPGPLATHFVRPRLYDRVDGLWQGGQTFFTEIDGADERLGCSAALSSTLAIFGAERDSAIGNTTGSVRIFDLVVQDVPTYLQQPQNAQAVIGGSTSFTVALDPSNNTSTSFGWQYELTPGSNTWGFLGSGSQSQGVVSGASGPTLSINSLTASAFVRYRARVNNACGTYYYSNPASLTTVVIPPACPADLGSAGGLPGTDGVLDNNDFIVFIDYFFNDDPRADLGSTGGLPGADNAWNNNDFIVFIDQFFAGC